MEEFDKRKALEELLIKRELDNQDTIEHFYQYIGKIIATHENIDVLLYKLIHRNIWDIAEHGGNPIDENSRWERQSAFSAIFDNIIVRGQSNDLRKVFCETTKQWFQIAKQVDPSVFTFTPDHLGHLEEVLEFETSVRNRIAHTSFGFPIGHELVPLEKIFGHRLDKKEKSEGTFTSTVYDWKDFAEFCRFQSGIANALFVLLNKTWLNVICEPGIFPQPNPLPTDCKGADKNSVYNTFLTVTMSELYSWKGELKIKAVNPTFHTGGPLMT